MTTARRKPTKPRKPTGATKAATGATKPRKPTGATKAATGAKRATATKPAKDTIVLTGPPSLVRATVSVENAVDQRVAVRGLTLHRTGRQALTGSGAAVIAPGATADLPVSFRLDPDTPPGEYAAEVEVGGIRREAVLRVEPDLTMHVSPRRVLADVGGNPLTLTLANDGNLTIALASVVRAHTDDGSPDPEAGPDVTLTLTAAATLAPGTTTVLEGHLTVPEDLDPTRRHTARIPVGTADLDVIILPRDPSE